MAKKTEPSFPLPVFGSKELGQAIKRVRRLRGFTQAELAMQTNSSVKFISQVENGKETAQVGKVLLLVRILDMGVQLTDLKSKG